jgi:putative chitinase
MLLGALVVIVVGWVVISYFRNSKTGKGVINNGVSSEQNDEEVYVVQKGDNLWKIAESKLGDGFKWQEIAHANGITNPDLIETGQKLNIPTISAGENIVKSEKYTVQGGDNLWSIAVKNYGDGYKWVDIARANNLKNPNVIHVGNEFVMP